MRLFVASFENLPESQITDSPAEWEGTANANIHSTCGVTGCAVAALIDIGSTILHRAGDLDRGVRTRWHGKAKESQFRYIVPACSRPFAGLNVGTVSLVLLLRWRESSPASPE